jgi:beta-phosphoglucomutase-like phosphatase (HAD superfamily)
MKTAPQALPVDALDAVILDLEDVVTQTKLLHARAWQTIFGAFFRGRPNGSALSLLDARKDYLPYFDGKPCLDGIRNSLASRGMRLPEGSPRAAPGTETLHGLSSLKNKILLRLVEEERVDVYTDAAACIRQWRAGGKKIAVITPGKYGGAIIRRAGLDHLFDVLVDATALSRPSARWSNCC